MRPILMLGVFALIAACSGGEFMPGGVDVERLPVDKKGNLFFGRELEW